MNDLVKPTAGELDFSRFVYFRNINELELAELPADALRGVEDLEEAVGRARRALDGAPEVGERAEGEGDEARVEEERRKIAADRFREQIGHVRCLCGSDLRDATHKIRC